MDDDPVVAGENASDLALVPLGQKFNAHSGIITDILFGSGYAGLGIKGGILLNAPSTEDNRATLDVGRWTVGPTIEIRLPARFSAALDAALYRRTSFSTGRSIGGEQFFDTSHTTEWGFPLYAKYRFTEVPFHPFVAGGAAFKYLRTSGTAGCSGTEPSLCGPNPGVSNLVITSPIG